MPERVRRYDVHRVSSLFGPVDPSFRAISGRLKFAVRRHEFDNDSFSLSGRSGPDLVGEPAEPEVFEESLLVPERRHAKQRQHLSLVQSFWSVHTNRPHSGGGGGIFAEGRPDCVERLVLSVSDSGCVYNSSRTAAAAPDPVLSLWYLRWRSNSSGKRSYELPTRGTVCGTMRSMCGTFACRLARSSGRAFSCQSVVTHSSGSTCFNLERLMLGS